MKRKHLRSASMGFTLIELVLAIALGALLMAAMVGVLKGATQQLRIAQQRTRQSWHTATLEQMHRDMLLASRIHSSDGWVWLEGEFNEFSGQRDKSKRVGYQCVPWIDGRGALVRNSDQATELLAIGPRRMVIERLDANNMPQPLSAVATPMPERVRVWIWTDDAINAEVLRDIVLR